MTFHASGVRQSILMAAVYTLLAVAVVVLAQLALGTFKLRK